MGKGMYRYHLEYRRHGDLRRTYRMTVNAEDADEAREVAAVRDPDYWHTVKPPQRRAQIIPFVPEDHAAREGVPEANVVPPCAFCGRTSPILAGTYTRVAFEDGIRLVCDDCGEKGREFVEWRGTEVELTD